MHINLNAMGTRMKRRRKELKMSQAELAEKVNVSNNHNTWEHCRNGCHNRASGDEKGSDWSDHA